MSRRVVIERLRVRVPGGDPEAAERLGRAVAHGVAERLAGGSPVRPAGAVRVPAPGAREAGAIADAVVRNLR